MPIPIGCAGMSAGWAVMSDRVEVVARKLAMLRRFVQDLGHYADLDHAGRRREHYAVERLLQLLCEAAADIGLQILRAGGDRLASSYRDVFVTLRDRHGLPPDMAEQLMDACGMRNVLTHLYDTIDLDRVAEAVDPALDLYGAFADWADHRVQGPAR